MLLLKSLRQFIYFILGIFKFCYNDPWIMDIGKSIGWLGYIREVSTLHLQDVSYKAKLGFTCEEHLSGEGNDRMRRDTEFFNNTKDKAEPSKQLMRILLSIKILM